MSYKYHTQRLIDKHAQWRHYDGDMRLCWYAKMNQVITFEEVFERMAKEYFHGMADAITCLPDMQKLKEQYDIQEMDSLVMEDMLRTFTGDDTMRCCSPKTYKRFSYKPTDEMWDVEYNFYGRGGGWLALDKFEGVRLNQCFEDVEYANPATCNRWFQKLCCMIVEITWMVDQRYDEHLHGHAFQLYAALEDERIS